MLIKTLITGILYVGVRRHDEMLFGLLLPVGNYSTISLAWTGRSREIHSHARRNCLKAIVSSCDLGLTADSKDPILPEGPRCNGLAFCLAFSSIWFLEFYAYTAFRTNARLEMNHVFSKMPQKCDAVEWRCTSAPHLSVLWRSERTVQPATSRPGTRAPLRGSVSPTMNPEQPMPSITVKTCQETKLKA